MESAGVLLVATPQRLLVIDVTKLKINHYESSEFEIPPLPVLKVFNLVEAGFPFGMCFFVRESKLYMVGGEKPAAGTLPELLRIRKFRAELDESFGQRGLSRDIYVSDLTGLDSITKFSKHPLTMLAAKPSPIVAEIEGKIYVLSGDPWHIECLLPTPTFEVFDPLVGKWEALPEPPFYAEYSHYECQDYDCQDFSLIGHSVVGTTIYVLANGRSGANYFSYCVNARVWKSLGKSVKKIGIPFPLSPLCSGKFVPAYNDIFIGFYHEHLFAAWIPSDGGPIHSQALEEVYEDYYLCRHMLSCDGLVVEMGEHEMCIMQTGILPLDDETLGKLIPEDLLSDDPGLPIPGRCTLYMATFRVEKLHSSAQVRAETNILKLEQHEARGPKLAKTADASDVSQTSHHDNDVQDDDVSVPTPFLSITCLSKGFYNLDAWGYETSHICSAFFRPWNM